MRLEHYSEKKLKAQILEIIGRYLDLSSYRVFIFGSRVSGHHSERSDIDIGIQGPQEIPGHIRVEILEEIDRLPVLYKFDLVDFSTVTPEFKKEALSHAEDVI
jgi:predicted nucleotidyltransferase